MSVLLNLFKWMLESVPVTRYKNTDDDNNPRLCYRLTIALSLVCCCTVVTVESIDYDLCKDYTSVDGYCWINGTFPADERPNDRTEEIVRERGVDGPSTNEIVVHNYYEQVYLVFVLLTMFLYIPRLLWRIFEHRLLKMLVGDLESSQVLSSWTEDRKEMLFGHFTSRSVFARNVYVCLFVFCEFLNAVNIILQIFVLRYFVRDRFVTETTVDAADRSSKCTLGDLVSNGGESFFNGSCSIDTDEINEKLFALVRYLCVIVTVISTYGSSIHLVLFFCQLPRFRILSALCSSFTEPAVTKLVVDEFTYGEWFLLYVVGKNVGPQIFSELIEYIGCKLVRWTDT